MVIDFRERGRWLARNILPHEPLLRARLRRVHVHGLEVEDIIQEVYARIAEHPAPETIRYPRQYALQIANSIIVDHIRHSRVISISASGNLEQLDVISPDAGPEEHLEFREEIARVAGFLATLPETTRETLILRRVEKLSQAEVAARLGISVKTVEKHTARAALMLMNLFGRGGKVRSRPSTVAKKQQADAGLKSDDDEIVP